MDDLQLREAYERLVGSKQAWIQRCIEAVSTRDQGWLKRAIPVPLLSASLPELDIINHYNPLHKATCQAIAGCAYAASLLHGMPYPLQEQTPSATTTLREISETLLSSSQIWQSSHRLASGRHSRINIADLVWEMVASPSSAPTPQHRIRELVGVIKGTCPTWELAPIIDLTSHFYSSGGPGDLIPERTVEVRFPIQVGVDGLLGTLRLELMPQGLGELYPDPMTMSYLVWDDLFRTAVDTGWKYSEQWRDRIQNQDVRWSIYLLKHAQYRTPLPERMEGASIGAAFGLGLKHLLVLGLPALDPKWAITGEITLEGRLLGVGGYTAKLEAIKRENLKVIVPTDDFESKELNLQRDWQHRLEDLRCADSIDAASSIASGLMGELLGYLTTLEKDLADPPPYYPADFDFGRTRQRVNISRSRMQYSKEFSQRRYWHGRDQPSDDEAYGPLPHLRGREMYSDVGYWDAIRPDVNRAILLADPGYGKTRLLMYEGQLVAGIEKAALETGKRSPDSVQFPIFLMGSTLSRYLNAKNGDVVEAIVAFLEQDYHIADSSVLTKWLRRRLLANPRFGATAGEFNREPPYLLLLDALDLVPRYTESADPDTPDPIMIALKTLAERGRGRILLTSRLTAYHSSSSPLRTATRAGQDAHAFQELELVAFDRQQVEDFIDAWFVGDPGKAMALKAHIGKPGVGSLVRIPLLLSYICLLAQKPGELPTTRAALYDEVVHRLLERKWRGASTNVQRNLAKIGILQELAWHFAAEIGGWQDDFTAGELRSEINSRVATGRFPELAAAENLLDELSVQDALLVKVADAGRDGSEDLTPYTFLHPTIHEYLVASYLAELTPKERLKQIRPHLWMDVDWEEVLILLTGRLTERRSEPDKLLKALISLDSDPFHSMLLTAGRCVAEVGTDPLPESQVTLILNELAMLLHSISDVDRYRAVQVLAGLASLPASNSSGGGQQASSSDSWFIEFLSDASPGERIEATAALARIGEAAIPVLAQLRLLTDAKRYVREQAADVLSWMGEAAIPTLVQLLQGENPEAREQATDALAKIGEAAIPTLVQLLQGESPEAREQAARALAHMGDERAIPVLVQLLKHKHWDVRKRSAKALAGMRSEQAVQEAVPALSEFLDSRVSELRLEAAEMLAGIGEAAVPVLAGLLKDSNTDVRIHAAEALAALGDERAVPVLAGLLREGPTTLRERAASALASMGRKAIPVLAGLLKDSDWDIRRTAANALDDIGPASTPALIELLRDESPYARLEAAATLTRRWDDQALKQSAAVLVRLLHDPDFYVSLRAADVLSRVYRRVEATPGLLPNLCRALSVRWQAQAKDWSVELANSFLPIVYEVLLRVVRGLDRRSRESLALNKPSGRQSIQALTDYLLATGLRTEKRWACEAESRFRRVLAVMPEFRSALIQLSELLLRWPDRAEEASELLEKYLLTPAWSQDALAWNMLGDARRLRSDYKGAWQAYKEGVAIEQESAITSNDQNNGLRALYTRNSAQACLSIAATLLGISERPPENVEAHPSEWLEYAKGLLDEAALLDSDRPELSLLYARLYFTRGELGRARDLCNSALELRAEFPEAAFLLGLLYLIADGGNVEQANSVYEYGIELTVNWTAIDDAIYDLEGQIRQRKNVNAEHYRHIWGAGGVAEAILARLYAARKKLTDDWPKCSDRGRGHRRST